MLRSNTTDKFMGIILFLEYAGFGGLWSIIKSKVYQDLA